MTNAERIARDLCLLSGRYERGEIKAKDFVKQSEALTVPSCDNCHYGRDACFKDHRLKCADGFEMWLEEEI